MPAKPKTGRPTKYNAETRRVLSVLAKKGFTDEEMAEVVGITKTTLQNWKKAHPDFFDSLKDWKDEVDHAVERSLYENACNGNVTAQIFWLKNRKRAEWRDRQDVKLSGEVITEVKVTFVEKK